MGLRRWLLYAMIMTFTASLGRRGLEGAMNRVFTAAFALLILIASGISASAETLDVTWIAAFNGTAVPIATWQQDSNPTPLGFGPA